MRSGNARYSACEVDFEMLRGRSWRARPASPALLGWSPPGPGRPRRSGGYWRVCAAVLITESSHDRPASPGCWGRAAGSAAAGRDGRGQRCGSRSSRTCRPGQVTGQAAG